MNKGELPVNCEGHLLNPVNMTSFPNIFALDKGTGYFSPDEYACNAVEFPENKYETTTELVGRTIAFLNLNCERIAEKRRLLIINIDRNKKALRLRGIPPNEVSDKLVDRYFIKEWPEFFTTLRCCIGAPVEEYLKAAGYQG